MGNFNYWIIVELLIDLMDCFLMFRLFDMFLGKKRAWVATRWTFALFFMLLVAAEQLLGLTWQCGAVYLLLLFLLGVCYEAPWERQVLTVFTCGSIRFACLLAVFFWTAEDMYFLEKALSVMLFFGSFLFISEWGNSVRGDTDEDEDGRFIFWSLTAPFAGLLAEGFLLCTDVLSGSVAAACNLGILVLELWVCFFRQVIRQNDWHIRQRDWYMQQTSYYRNQLRLIADSQEKIRALRHDMKNHILHLDTLLAQGKDEEAREYLDTMRANMQSPKELVSTGNEEFDSLLNYKISLANHLLKTVECQVQIPEDVRWQSFDNNVILGNLIDNAIEAAEKSEQKFICVEIRVDRGLLFIHIANSYRGPVRRKGEGFFSIKESPGEHGIGLQSVRHMVERQNGEISFHYNEERFEADVMLYMI